MFRRAAVLVVLLLGACGGSSDPTADPEQLAKAVPEAERYGGTAVVAMHVDPQSLNTLVADMEAGQLQLALLSLRLVRYDDDLQPVPLLAERWDTVRVASESWS